MGRNQRRRNLHQQETMRNSRTTHTNAVIAVRIGLTPLMISSSGGTRGLLKHRSVAKTAVGQRKCAWKEEIQQPRKVKAKVKAVTMTLRSSSEVFLLRPPRKL